MPRPVDGTGAGLMKPPEEATHQSDKPLSRCQLICNRLATANVLILQERERQTYVNPEPAARPFYNRP